MEYKKVTMSDRNDLQLLLSRNVEMFPKEYPKGIDYERKLVDEWMNEGKVVGVIGKEEDKPKVYCIGAKDKEGDVLVYSLYVDPSVQGRGEVVKLINQFIALCKKEGAETMYSWPSNPRIAALWERFLDCKVNPAGGVMVRL